jgi:hypothetical protein
MARDTHHILVLWADTGWCHETAFDERQDALDERDDYRGRYGVKKVRIVRGPDSFEFARQTVAELRAQG